jgi:hypothetical protein
VSWWLRALGIRATLLSTALAFLAAWFVGQSEIPMPDVTGKAGVFLAVHLLGVVPVVFLMHGLTNRDLRMEISAARSWHVRAIAVVCGMVATWWCISAVIVAITHESPAGSPFSALDRLMLELQGVSEGPIYERMVGNLLDRIRLGHVIDFLSLGVPHVQSIAFNVADLALVAGISFLTVRAAR